MKYPRLTAVLGNEILNLTSCSDADGGHGESGRQKSSKGLHDSRYRSVVLSRRKSTALQTVPIDAADRCRGFRWASCVVLRYPRILSS